jgi:hypothetical protein
VHQRQLHSDDAHHGAQQHRLGAGAEDEEALALGPDRQGVAEVLQRQGGEHHRLSGPAARPRHRQQAGAATTLAEAQDAVTLFI